MRNIFEVQEQQELNWCWAAVTSSVHRYFTPHPPLGQCQIATATLGGNCCVQPVPDDLNSPHSLEDVLINFGAHAVLEHNPLSFQDLKKQIDNSLPVCAYIQWPGGPDRGHFVVLIGYGLTGGVEWVDVADPFHGYQCVPYKVFRLAYQGIGTWAYTYRLQPPIA